MNGMPLQPGVNVDALDIPAGIRMLKEVCGYTGPNTEMLIEYCLRRHARGEEEQAQRQAIGNYPDLSNEERAASINLTSWGMVLAAAKAGRI